MACRTERARQIELLATGHLPAEETDELLAHLEACAACSDELDLAAELVRVADEQGAAAFAPARRGHGLYVLLAAAAAVLLFLGVRAALRGGEAPGLAELAAVEPLPAPESTLRAPGDPHPERAAAWAAAMAEYRAARWPAAVDAFDALAEGEPEGARARLYLGMAALQAGDAERAAAALEAARALEDGLLAEPALWYLAHARLALGDAARATEALVELEAMEGDYELNAARKLARLRALAGDD